jgi:hypothetical protein
MSADDKATRRQMLAAAGTAIGAALPAGALGAETTQAPAGPPGAAPQIAPTILEYLGNLENAVHELANTWRPNDPKYRADVYRQIMMNLSYSYFALFHADAEHPDWAPLWNPVYAQQPNPDTIYLYAPLRGDLTYRVSGDRGTCHSVVFSTQTGFTGFVGTYAGMSNFHTFDDTGLKIGPDNHLEIIFSAKRPAGYTGNWAPLGPGDDTMMVRYVSQDWEKERDPQLTIECLDKVPLKRRLTPDEIVERIRRMAQFPANMDKIFFNQQNDLKTRLGVNKFEIQHLTGVEFQYYWPAAFEFSPGEALVVETDLPKVRPYWNLQLNDPYFNCIEYVYRLSSLNGVTGKPGSDGRLYAVAALEDPGVPNWLDTAGYTEGTFWGRWYGCDSTPLPTIKRVPFAKIRDYLPKDTPTVTPEQRTEELRARVRACQRRRRW